MDEKSKIYDLCLKEISKHAETSFKYVPDEIKTEGMCMTAIINAVEASAIIPYIPVRLLTERICIAAVSNLRNALKYLPDESLSERICIEAVSRFEDELQYVPRRFQTDTVFMAAVKKSGRCLKYIPDERRSREICKAAFENNMNVITDVPKQYATEEMCITALKNNIALASDLKGYLPDEVISLIVGDFKKQCEEESQAFERVVDKVRRISEKPNTFKELSFEERQNPVLCQVAVETDGMLLRYIPKELRNIQLCTRAVCGDVDALYFVPDEIKAAVIDDVRKSGFLLKILFSESEFKDLFF